MTSTERDSSHLEHALCAPSDSKRWMNCAGAIAMCRGIEKPESEYAAEGTLAHKIAAEWLLRLPPTAVPPDEEFANHVQTYVQQIRARVNFHKQAGAHVELLVEVRVDLEPVTGEQGAKCTIDALIVAEYPDGRAVLEVRDLKFGQGVPVSVVDNPQLQIYACCALHRYTTLQFDEVILGIHQPRITEQPSEVSLTPQQLLEFEPSVRAAAALALDLYHDAPADAIKYLAKEPGEDVCRWCPIKSTCPAYTELVFETVFSEFQDVSDPDAVPLKPATEHPGMDLGQAILRVDTIEQWCREVRAEVERRLLAGQPVVTPKGPMWLKVGREGNRKWTDPQAAEKLLQTAGLANVIYSKPELLSVAKIEKVAAKRPVWESLQSFITREPGKPSVAYPGEDGVPYAPPSADEFDSFDGSSLV